MKIEYPRATDPRYEHSSFEARPKQYVVKYRDRDGFFTPTDYIFTRKRDAKTFAKKHSIPTK